MKKIFESRKPIEVQSEDNGQSLIIIEGEPIEDVFPKAEIGLNININSWDDETKEHKDMNALIGKRIRITLEIIS